MFRGHDLLFPALNRIGDASLKSSGDTGKVTGLYKLSWDFPDRIKRERWTGTSYPGTLPEPFDTWVQGMTFAPTGLFLDEIRRSTFLACAERSRPVFFDNMLKEICLEPSVGYTFVAFSLISDCLYDPEAQFYYRGNDKPIAAYALLYKFWMHQVPWLQVRENARISRLESMLLHTADPVRKGIQRFLTALSTLERQLDDRQTGGRHPHVPSRTDDEQIEHFLSQTSADMNVEDGLIFWHSGEKQFQEGFGSGRLKKTTIDGQEAMTAELQDLTFSPAFSNGTLVEITVAKGGRLFEMRGEVLSMATTPPVTLDIAVMDMRAHENT